MSKKIVSKTIILGDSGVGKTSLLNAFVDQKFSNSYKATIGADFLQKDIVVDGKVVSLEIWDTAGQERFKSFGKAFYQGANCCVLVYDITNKKSFQNLESWITEFLNKGSPQDEQKFPFIVVGNKIDRNMERKVSEEAIQQFLAKHPVIKYFSASAKNLQGVVSLFDNIALASIENRNQEIFHPINIRLTGQRDRQECKNKKVCC